MFSIPSSNLGGGICKEDFCSCSRDHFAIEEVQWTSVDLPLRFLWEIFRAGAYVATGSASSWVNGGLKDGTHDYILVKCRYRNCGQNPWLIYEFGPAGKEKHVGYYRSRNEPKRYFHCNRHFTYQMIEDVYRGMPTRGYDLVNCNCGHWACDMYGAVFSKAIQVDGVL